MTRYGNTGNTSCKAIKLDGSSKNWAIYAIEVDGTRLDHLRVFVRREYINRGGHSGAGAQKGSFKGNVTRAEIVDQVKLRALRKDASYFEQESATLFKASKSEVGDGQVLQEVQVGGLR